MPGCSINLIFKLIRLVLYKKESYESKKIFSSYFGMFVYAVPVEL